MQIAVRLVEDSEEGVRRKFVEEIEQCQSRDAYAIFEHIDVLLFVEGKLFVDGFEKGFGVAVVSRLLYHMRKYRIVFIRLSRHTA